MPAPELTLKDADGTNITRLTTDGGVRADNQWRPRRTAEIAVPANATKIVCRQTVTVTNGNARLRRLTFDDCAPVVARSSFALLDKITMRSIRASRA